ncbi:MAG: ECF transporter S component, partial [Eubacterium sp.]|nr:ECF transporter S component [Eubacterium sp.]
MAAVSLPSNLFIIYPLYYNVMGFPEPAILGMYQALLPAVKNMVQALLIFNVPFTFIKGLICVGVSMLIYKPLSPILHGRKN